MQSSGFCPLSPPPFFFLNKSLLKTNATKNKLMSYPTNLLFRGVIYTRADQ